MKPFKFLGGIKTGTISTLDGVTYATASIYNPSTHWTPEESERLRIERMRISEEFNNNAILTDQQNRLAIYSRIRERREQELRNRDNVLQHVRQFDEQLRLFQATTTVTVNPTPWTKVKIFGTKIKLLYKGFASGIKTVFKESWLADPIGVVFVSSLATLLTFIGIAKLFGA